MFEKKKFKIGSIFFHSFITFIVIIIIIILIYDYGIINLFFIHINQKINMMMLFSIGTGLKRVGIVGLELELLLDRSAGSGCHAPLQK